MLIKKYGLVLKEVEREDLELIRQYRNTDIIKNKMIYRKQISREEQLRWFDSIRNSQHFYFLIYKNDSAIGLINGKNIDFNERTSEGGIFVWNEDRNYETSITASIILNDWNFFINNFKKNYAQVIKSNKKAIAYNEFMGYVISDKAHPNPDVLWMEQSKADYERYRKKLEKFDFEDFKIGNPVSIDDIFIEKHEIDYANLLISEVPEDLKKIYTSILKRTMNEDQ